MMRIVYPVHQRVSEKHVGMRHIYLCPQHLLPFLETALSHLSEKRKVFFNASVSVGAVYTGSAYRAAASPYLLLRLVVYVRQPFPDKHACPLVKLLEIIRCIELVGPFKTKPFYIFLY